MHVPFIVSARVDDRLPLYLCTFPGLPLTPVTSSLAARLFLFAPTWTLAFYYFQRPTAEPTLPTRGHASLRPSQQNHAQLLLCVSFHHHHHHPLPWPLPSIATRRQTPLSARKAAEWIDTRVLRRSEDLSIWGERKGWSSRARREKYPREGDTRPTSSCTYLDLSPKLI
jgi:hypothetical protein